MKPWAAWVLMDDGVLLASFHDTEPEAARACDSAGFLANYDFESPACDIAGGWMRTEDLLDSHFIPHLKEMTQLDSILFRANH